MRIPSIVSLVLALAAFGCSSEPGATGTDASVDPPSCANEIDEVALPLGGSFPGGSLARFGSMYAGFLYCSNSYGVIWHERADACWADPSVSMFVELPYNGPAPAPGDILPATAVYYDPESTTLLEEKTEAATFHVTYLGDPASSPIRIAGRFVIDAEGWAFDVEVDTVAQLYDTCL